MNTVIIFEVDKVIIWEHHEKKNIFSQYLKIAT